MAHIGRHVRGVVPGCTGPPLLMPPLRGACRWEAHLILHLLAFSFLRQSTIYIALHCTHAQTKRLRKEINYILVHNNTLQSWSSIALNIHFSILKIHYFYLWFLYKSDSCISWFRNNGEMKVSKVHFLNVGSLEITHVFHLRIITSYSKKYFKISFLPLTKSFIKKAV